MGIICMQHLGYCGEKSDWGSLGQSTLRAVDRMTAGCEWNEACDRYAVKLHCLSPTVQNDNDKGVLRNSAVEWILMESVHLIQLWNNNTCSFVSFIISGDHNPIPGDLQNHWCHKNSSFYGSLAPSFYSFNISVSPFEDMIHNSESEKRNICS